MTVQLPIYNEANVVERLLNSMAHLDYPRDRLEVQVLDDSDDETVEIAEQATVRQRLRGLQVTHLRRRERSGYKAGALASGLATSSGEFIAVFDADCIPSRDFLTATIGYFTDPTVAAVQTRWVWNDANASFLTRTQAVMLDMHFGIEQAGRSAIGCFTNFNGSGGVLRVSAIVDSGGWRDDTLTEDFDISYRAQLRGWRFVYLGDVVTETELPREFGSYRLQQYRWVKGVAQNAIHFAPKVLGAPLPWRVKAHAVDQLFESCLYGVTSGVPLISAGLVLLFPSGWLRMVGAFPVAFIAAGVLLWIGYIIHARNSRPAEGVGNSLYRWLEFFVFTLALSVHNSVAAVDGLARHGGEFIRTPKRGDGAERISYRSATLDRITLIETTMWLALFVMLAIGLIHGVLQLQWLGLLAAGGLTMVLAASLLGFVEHSFRPARLRFLGVVRRGLGRRLWL